MITKIQNDILNECADDVELFFYLYSGVNLDAKQQLKIETERISSEIIKN
jgi:hypothetical protein